MAEENKRMSRMYLDEEKKAKGGITPFPKIGYEDMTKMEDMSLDGVLENLRERYNHQLIYTYTSSILVAINPFKRLDIFDRNWVKYYKGKRIGLLSPHIFAIAEQAFNQMVESGKNQSVLVSGESGAGKTESTKLILQFLSARTDRESNIETMVLESVPVLESLGNAKTGRNDNSSRFGKFIEIQFDKEHYICGSKITPYLLEKSRIITQAKGERNYHIFYQLTEGMDDAEKAKYFLGRANDYKYLNTTGCIAIKGVDEKEELNALRRAMRIFEISDEIQENMFKIVASVLHLGNIEYRADGEVSAPADAGSIKALENASNLLGLEPGALTYALTHKKIQMRSEIINTPLTPQQSKDQTDALVKYLYSVLFEWMVNKLNQCTYSEISSHFIGVLDIFGFELFEHNSFEQFLINYANESLQNFFNHHIFKLEQVEYEKEKIDWTAIDFVDNKPCLDLIEQRKPPGILCVLDEESKFPKATDETFITKLHQNFDKKNAYYEKPRLAKDRFIVKHYAGAVEYEIEGWRDKNKDQLPEHLIDLVRESSNKFIAILYAPDGVLALKEGQSAPQAEKDSKGDNKLTLGAQFKTQLVSLMDMLSATTPYFIRCVKPNMQKVPDKFDSELIYNQLLYAGMLETIRIRRMGYPIRYPHDDFWKRFKCICPEVSFSKGDVQGSVANLLRALGLNSPKDYQLGLTKVFLKQDISNQLEDRRNVALTATIIKMQTWWRLMAWHSQFVEQMNNSVVLQMFWRMGTKRTKFVKKRKAAKNIQLWLRMTRARKMMIALREKKRKEEEERKRKEEEERQRKIKEMGREAVEKEEEEKRLADAAKEAEEMEKFKALAEGEFGAVKADSEDQEEKEEIKSDNIINEDEDRRDSKLAGDPRTRNSIMMKTGDKLEVPIDVDGRITLGLGWKGGQWDMDASCLLFRYKEHRDDVYYYNPRSKDGAITHKGGFAGLVRNNQAEGDAEQIDCTLSKISPKTTTLLFVVTVFSPEGNFSSVRDAYVRIIDPATQNEFCRYTLNQSGEETARIMCKLYRYGFTQWRIQALGEPAEGRLYKHMIPKVEPFLDSKPPKRKFRIRIHRGKFVDSKAKSKSKSTTLNSYCEIRYDIDKSKTKVVKKSLNPQWRSTKEVSGNSGVLEICVLHKARFAKEVTRRLDWRGATSTSVLLGIVVVPLTADNVQIQESWFPIEHKGDAKSKSKITGEIKLTIQEMLI